MCVCVIVVFVSCVCFGDGVNVIVCVVVCLFGCSVARLVVVVEAIVRCQFFLVCTLAKIGGPFDVYACPP